MNRDHFYITLFSNACQHIYPDSKIAAITIKLAQPIRLDPSEIWEVGLGGLSSSAILFEGIGIHHSNSGLQITHDMYINGFFMIVYDLTPDLAASEGHASPLQTVTSGSI